MTAFQLLDARSCSVIETVFLSYHDYANSLLYAETIPDLLLGQAKIITFKTLTFVKKLQPVFDMEAGKDFVSGTLIPHTSLRIAVSARTKLIETFPESWEELFDSHPGKYGLVMFSLVGFNKDGTRAVTYGQWNRGTRYHGHIFSLSASQSGWRIDAAMGLVDG